MLNACSSLRRHVDGLKLSDPRKSSGKSGFDPALAKALCDEIQIAVDRSRFRPEVFGQD
jgi:hypothetical protein